VQISWHFIFEGGEASRYPWDFTSISMDYLNDFFHNYTGPIFLNQRWTDNTMAKRWTDNTMAKTKSTNNYLKNTTQRTKDQEHEPY
jgi:hypothetical protein